MKIDFKPVGEPNTAVEVPPNRTLFATVEYARTALKGQVRYSPTKAWINGTIIGRGQYNTIITENDCVKIVEVSAW
ncbi:hypothetical protein A3C86_04825 [Candidatus Kaiserbacteria bacterium RIFCSPHIGHO2_02_FULL_49_16]|uniref:TGS domain-containing protein n=1 Tax=Candidatus Kaiserbacteria bacterium RIFCSPHIGHO2_02_FULL_49_16 TaxID=1798490 RepID=A0A1F6DAN7_9BACT|nr:MAG: hypothetical protein UY79_C0021G0005 [Parcubacteria group bacterium GW2011_GWA2_53_21]OGG58479.1 MAG: hypothetical protein A3C86_04825 [Candidatus Kaiserbacteria bacterium RIFCSPHIGHO2_02_FULL_49_16]